MMRSWIIAFSLIAFAVAAGTPASDGPVVRQKRHLKGHVSSVLSVDFSPDGKTLATSGRDDTIKLWDATTGKLKQTLTEHTGDVYSAIFSPKGDLLASGSADKTVRIWNSQTGKLLRIFKGHTDIVRSVAFSPDQKTLASAGVDQTIRLWDVRSGMLIKTLAGHTARVMTVEFSPGGELVASASSDKTARIWNAQTGQLQTILRGHSSGLEAATFSPDGKTLASSSNDGTVRLWDVQSGKVRFVLEGHVGEIDCVGFSHDGKTVASGCKDKTVKLWNAKDGKLLRTVTGHTGRVESLTFSPDDRMLATGGGGGDTSVRLWTVTSNQNAPKIKSESFDKDPGWDGLNNRLLPEVLPTVTQDFGYSDTNFAGQAKGEMGGRVRRSSRPAYYADKIATKSLNDELKASGTFAITKSDGSGGVFFGWFNADQKGSGRPISSLGLELDFEHNGARLMVRLITQTNKSCGTYVHEFIPGKFRAAPLKVDGTRYHWTFHYDPTANTGKGRFQFRIKSTSKNPQKFEDKWNTVDVPEGFMQDGATFDRFGLHNTMKAGNTIEVYFDDLQYNGQKEDFSNKPNWHGSGNRDTYKDRELLDTHDFGYSAKTSFAGGRAGEIGGLLWRAEKTFGYYAGPTEELTLNDRLEASGKVILVAAAPDSDIGLGWFSSKGKDKSPDQTGKFLGIAIGGPSRAGHYFLPAYAVTEGRRHVPNSGPLLIQGKVHKWKLKYHPAANDGRGAIQVTLDDQTKTLNLEPGAKNKGVCLDRFGLFTITAGGSHLRIYLDDLQYTADGSGR